ncbi:MAG: heavy-metal-associated domain-containing protein [Nitrosomonadales bacterium]|nr:heavy-metal-associated domain-containing protein [Nitrosomonadales bacterium]
METIQLSIQGMTCNGCVGSVKKVLQALPGVSGVEVSLEHNRATLTYDPAQTGMAQFKAAVEDAGYDVA